MRSLERRFKELEQKNPNMSSLGVFITTINKQKFGEQTLKNWFNKLVDKEDYDKSVKRELIDYLKLLNRAEEIVNRG